MMEIYMVIKDRRGRLRRSGEEVEKGRTSYLDEVVPVNNVNG